MSTRELELSENRLGLLLLAWVLLLASMLYAGAWLAQTSPVVTASTTAPVEMAASIEFRRLPAGFMGPPAPPYPPPVGGAPGRGCSRSQTSCFAVDVRPTASLELTRRRLLVEGWPSYLASKVAGEERVRVGDYATRAEAELVAQSIRDVAPGAEVVELQPVE